MTKLCPRGKAAAKRKFKVYPSAYANAYASRICAGKIKDPSGVKRKDFRGSKAEGGRIGLKRGGGKKPTEINKSNLKNTLKKIKKFTPMGMTVEVAKKIKDLTKEKPSPKPERQFRGPKKFFFPKKLERPIGTPRPGVLERLRKNKPQNLIKGERSPKRAIPIDERGPQLVKRSRPKFRKGGGVCLRGMNRDAIGKNS